MRKQSISFYQSTWAGVLLAALSLVFALTAQAEQFVHGQQGQSKAYGHSMASWTLTNLSTSSRGQVVRIKEGKFTRQYVLQADAESVSDSSEMPVKARFELVMDVFSPFEDMGRQKRGRYYVQGLWELEGDKDDLQASDETLTGKIKGRIQAELNFDPTTKNRDWKGIVQIPMSRVRSDMGRPGVRPMRGGGELTFAEDGTGTLDLNLKLWPKF